MGALRSESWRGGLTLAVRQLAGMAISFAGLVLLARLIGAEAYGVYVSALAIQTGLVLLFQCGIDLNLIRAPADPAPAEIHQGFSLALALGAAGAVLAWPAGRLAEAWIGADGTALALTVLMLGMPLQLANQVPSALLQRRMAFGPLVRAELAGQAALHGGGVAAAAAGWGLAAPLAGWWLQQLTQAALLYPLAGYRPRLVWHWPTARRMALFGTGYAASVWSWRLRDLANPLIVARVLGPEAAANVAIALRMVEALSFMRTVVYRVSLPALSRMQAQPARLARAVSEGMRLQVLGIGLPLAAFAAVAPWALPLAFGQEWSASAELFPFLALGGLVSGGFSLHSSLLFALGRTGDVTRFHLANVALLMGVAALAVPAHGLAGYAAAELAALASHGVLHAHARKRVGPIPLGLGLSWSTGFALPLFAGTLGPAAWAGPVLVLALPATRRALSGWWTQIKEAAHG